MNALVTADWALRARTLVTRWLILSHRWLGIPLSLIILVWFLSGITMMYAGGMPRLTPQGRLDHLPALDLARVRLTPAQAAEPLGGEEALPGAPLLLMIQGRPAYRFPYAGNATVHADDGSLLEPLDAAAAMSVARQFLREPAPGLRLVGLVETPDQWTLSLGRQLPLMKFAAGDARGTELYVSTLTGEVVLKTTRRDRALAWIGTIPHWLYFSALRANQPLWYRIVVTLAALACVVAVLGLALAFTQWRRTRPLNLRRSIPYRGGMRWHYIAGAIFGLFVLTWGFSGLLSMEPFAWTNTPDIRVDPEALTGGEPQLASFDSIDLAALPALVAPRLIKEVAYLRIHGDHYLSLRTAAPADAPTASAERRHAPYGVGGRAQEGHVLVDAATMARHDMPFDSSEIVARISAALPDAHMQEQALLQDYDDYYYSRAQQTPLPVLRIKLDDPLQTWLYIDPRTSQIVANIHRYSRIERWLYNGLHSLDFRFWYAKRPLWDLVMLSLLAGGVVSSSLGLWFGIRRLWRNREPHARHFDRPRNDVP
ncbi:MAG: PepSY domain-containing protein [Steroidobacteraceae bacterium]